METDPLNTGPQRHPGSNSWNLCYLVQPRALCRRNEAVGLDIRGFSWTVLVDPKCERVVASAVSDSLRPHGLQPARLLCPWDSPGKSTGVGGHSLLQGTVLMQGSKPGLSHCRQILIV